MGRQYCMFAHTIKIFCLNHAAFQPIAVEIENLEPMSTTVWSRQLLYILLEQIKAAQKKLLHFTSTYNSFNMEGTIYPIEIITPYHSK